MRKLAFLFLLLFLTYSGFGQDFLEAYKKFRLERTNGISDTKTRKKSRRFVRSHMVELDTIFQSYRSRHSFDFNTADTVFMIYDAPAMSPFTSNIIIWAGRDTICYRQGFELLRNYRLRRTITYTSLIPAVTPPDGYTMVTERDSLIRLVAKLDFETIYHLGDNQ